MKYSECAKAALVAALLAGILLPTYAQDTRFSQYYFAPTQLNPALLGKHNGLFRVCGNYRSQYGSLDGGIQQTGASFDLKTSGALALGASLLDNRAGAFTEDQLMVGGAYSFYVGQASSSMISLGAMGGGQLMQLDRSKLRLEDSTEVFDRNSIFNPELSFGLLYTRTSPFEKAVPFIGVSAYHLLPGKKGFTSAPEPFVLEPKYLAHTGVQISLEKFWDLTPHAAFVMQGENSVVMAGAFTRRYLREMDAALSLGGQWSQNNAIIASIALQYGDFIVGLSYDINTSPLSGNLNSGNDGFELALQYLVRKPGRFRDIPSCPRL